MSMDKYGGGRRKRGGILTPILMLLGLAGFVALVLYGYHTFTQREAAQAKLVAIGQSYTTNTRADATAFDKELEDSGLQQALTLESLARAGGIAKARDALKAATAITARYRALWDKRADEMRAGLKQLPLDPSERDKVVANMDKAFDAQASDAASYWNSNEAILDETSALIEDLAKARGWQVVGGRAMFTRQSDLDRFNGHVIALNRLRMEAELARTRITSHQMWIGVSEGPPGTR